MTFQNQSDHFAERGYTVFEGLLEGEFRASLA